MTERMKVFADDSIAAMARITRELGDDARIYSTRQIHGGIEIVAGRPNETPPEAPARRRPPKRQHDFIALMEGMHKQRSSAAERPTKPQDRPKSESTNLRLRALETCIAELKAIVGLDQIAKALRSAGGSSELIALFRAQAGDLEAADADRRFAGFLAARLAAAVTPTLAPRTIVLAGPSGAGKTTLLAQLAARLRMERPDARLAFVDAEPNEIGSAERLRHYGHVLDVAVLGFDQWSETKPETQQDRAVTYLVDAPSRADAYAEALASIERRRFDLPPLWLLGVIPANLSSEAAQACLENLPALDALAMTKLDEGRPALALLAALALRRAPLAFLAPNPHLTRGLNAASAALLVDLILAGVTGAHV